MKKLIAIPLLVLYFVAVSGAMVQFHFCGSKLSSWQVNEARASCCCGDSAMPSGNPQDKQLSEEDCCSSKVITLKIAQDQNSVHGVYIQFPVLQIAIVPVYTFPVLEDIAQGSEMPAYRANAPPGLWQGIPLYKLHSRFTYYG